MLQFNPKPSRGETSPTMDFILLAENALAGSDPSKSMQVETQHNPNKASSGKKLIHKIIGSLEYVINALDSAPAHTPLSLTIINKVGTAAGDLGALMNALMTKNQVTELNFGSVLLEPASWEYLVKIINNQDRLGILKCRLSEQPLSPSTLAVLRSILDQPTRTPLTLDIQIKGGISDELLKQLCSLHLNLLIINGPPLNLNALRLLIAAPTADIYISGLRASREEIQAARFVINHTKTIKIYNLVKSVNSAREQVLPTQDMHLTQTASSHQVTLIIGSLGNERIILPTLPPQTIADPDQEVLNSFFPPSRAYLRIVRGAVRPVNRKSPPALLLSPIEAPMEINSKSKDKTPKRQREPDDLAMLALDSRSSSLPESFLSQRQLAQRSMLRPEEPRLLNGIQNPGFFFSSILAQDPTSASASASMSLDHDPLPSEEEVLSGMVKKVKIN